MLFIINALRFIQNIIITLRIFMHLLGILKCQIAENSDNMKNYVKYWNNSQSRFLKYFHKYKSAGNNNICTTLWKLVIEFPL